MPLLTAYVASSTLAIFLLRRSHNSRKSSSSPLSKRPINDLRWILRPLPLLLHTKRLFLQWARSNMVPFFLALEANNVGRILDLILAILLVVLVLQLDSGLVLVIGVESKPTLVIGGFLHTQDFVECDLPLLTLFQVILQRSDLSLELFDFLYMVSFNTSTRGSRCYIVRATRHGM